MVVANSRSNEFGHVVVFLVENDTPQPRWFTEKPSSRGGENAGESERMKKLQTELFVIVGIGVGGFDGRSNSMGTERGTEERG
jgi:hypothetical protein